MEPLWHDGERAAVESRLRAAIVGSDTTVQAGLEKLVSETHADEVIVVKDTMNTATGLTHTNARRALLRTSNGQQISRRSSSLMALPLASRTVEKRDLKKESLYARG